MKEKKEDEKHIEELKKKSRDYSVKDGIFSTIKSSVSDNYISPFAIAMNSPDFMIGLFSSVPGLIGPMAQLESSKLIGKHKRKKIVLTSVTVEIFTWLPLIIIALLYYYGIIVNLLPLMTLLFFCFYVITSNAGTPAWFSWIGDLIDEQHRGRWFGMRTAIFSLVNLLITVLAALLLDYLKKSNLTMFGFIFLFVIAFISRIISRHYLSKQYEPVIHIQKESYFTFRQFVKKAPYNNFGRFAIFRAMINMATAIAGPFFTLYMLRDLHFSYFSLMLVLMSATFFSLIFAKFWGRFSDKYGNYEILRITSAFICIIPIMWTFNDNPIYLIFIPQLLSGIGWGGFNLAASNYVFDCVTPQKRGLVFSYYELLNGIGVFIGAGIGSLLVAYIKISFMNVILFIFLISGVARILATMLFLSKIKEVRKKQNFQTSSFLKSLILRHRKSHDKEDRDY